MPLGKYTEEEGGAQLWELASYFSSVGQFSGWQFFAYCCKIRLQHRYLYSNAFSGYVVTDQKKRIFWWENRFHLYFVQVFNFFLNSSFLRHSDINDVCSTVCVFETHTYAKQGGSKAKGKKRRCQTERELSEYSFVCGYAAFGSAVVKFD